MNAVAAVIEPEVVAVRDVIVAHHGILAAMQHDAEQVALDVVAVDDRAVGALLDVDAAVEVFPACA